MKSSSVILVRRRYYMDQEARTALLIRCTTEEAELIRKAAKRERRTISGFILNAVTSRITTRNMLEQSWHRNRGERLVQSSAKRGAV